MLVRLERQSLLGASYTKLKRLTCMRAKYPWNTFLPGEPLEARCPLGGITHIPYPLATKNPQKNPQKKKSLSAFAQKCRKCQSSQSRQTDTVGHRAEAHTEKCQTYGCCPKTHRQGRETTHHAPTGGEGEGGALFYAPHSRGLPACLPLRCCRCRTFSSPAGLAASRARVAELEQEASETQQALDAANARLEEAASKQAGDGEALAGVQGELEACRLRVGEVESELEKVAGERDSVQASLADSEKACGEAAAEAAAAKEALQQSQLGEAKGQEEIEANTAAAKERESQLTQGVCGPVQKGGPHRGSNALSP